MENVKKFGRLTVISTFSVKWFKYHMCRCDCGTEKTIRRDHLRMGKIISCGCSRRFPEHEMVPAIAKHGKYSAKTYTAWASMKYRCLITSSKAYDDYGGRGIKICERWMNFVNFYSDMGNGPKGMSLERVDVNGDYCPENCKWATIIEQNRNTRKTLRFDYKGKVVALWFIAQQECISRIRLYGYIQRGHDLQSSIIRAKRVEQKNRELGIVNKSDRTGGRKAN